MKPEIKAKWIAALRSGNYKQTTGVLKRETDGAVSYCCLGVLCELASKEIENVWPFVLSSGILPSNVAQWAQHGEMVGIEIKGKVTRFAAYDLNDQHKNSFSEIADYLEADKTI